MLNNYCERLNDEVNTSREPGHWICFSEAIASYLFGAKKVVGEWSFNASELTANLLKYGPAIQH